jgi:hypothetical protein
MAKKGEEILRQRKEAKQKKLLFVLGPIFLLLMVWQGPGYLKMLTGGGSEPTAATTSTPTTTGATPDPGSAAPPSTALLDPSAVPAAPPAAGGLPDSDQPLGADTGQLISFGRFLSKDPFKQGVAPPSTSDASTSDTSGGSGSTGGTGSTGSAGSSGGTLVPPSTGTDGGGGDSSGGGSFTTASTAEIRVNGTTESVKRDMPFPASDPLFQLVSLTNTTAKIGLVAGSFSNGKKTVTLKLGKVLTLVSEPDGLRYRLKLISIKL